MVSWRWVIVSLRTTRTHHGSKVLSVELHRQGPRDQLAAHMRRGAQKYGYACVSADYRLAPQVSIKEIMEDVKDSISFIRNELPQHVPEGAVDVKRLAVCGSSAGGYLALLAGLYVHPKPNVVVAIYPITDPLGAFFTNLQPAPMGLYAAMEEELAPYLDPKAEPVANCVPEAAKDSRMHMAVFTTMSANLAELVGIPEAEDAAPFRVSRNVFEHGLPPAYFLHGDADSAVGVEQADEVVGAMLGLGVEVQYERVHGKDHFFNRNAEYENDRMYSFMMKHLR